VESSEGTGSTFHFTVCLGHAPAEVVHLAPVAVVLAVPTSTPNQTAPAPTSPRGLNVLLVEDHAINQLLATSLLKKWGHTVKLARDGREAVDLFPTEAWDVVLMDMQMPIMGGIEATQLIRANEPAGRKTPIIAVTANAMETDRADCLAAGMNDFLSKPLSAAALQAMLKVHC
jgi:CheY-like chemotaxis protein